ncbi:hypothetical protein U0070_019258 [Myodes glareolus]|uniref:Uncharacterized protein n=1 Tax=Myodes glareolus TaxID=447135 RepID=A0AAW0IXC2_MYOGA
MILAEMQPAPCQLVKTGLPVVLQPLLYRLKEGGSGKETQTTEQAFSFPHTKDRIHFLASRGSYQALKFGISVSSKLLTVPPVSIPTHGHLLCTKHRFQGRRMELSLTILTYMAPRDGFLKTGSFSLELGESKQRIQSSRGKAQRKTEKIPMMFYVCKDPLKTPGFCVSNQGRINSHKDYHKGCLPNVGNTIPRLAGLNSIRKVQEGECLDRLDPQNPVYAEETSPSAIVNGFSERLRASHIQRNWLVASLFIPSPTGLGELQWWVSRECLLEWELGYQDERTGRKIEGEDLCNCLNDCVAMDSSKALDNGTGSFIRRWMAIQTETHIGAPD